MNTNTNTNTIAVGSMVAYRRTFGKGPLKAAKILNLTLTAKPHTKDGLECPYVFVCDVKANRVLFDLDDGHWCYGDQVVIG